MSKSSQKPKKVASKARRDDFDLATVATIAATLMNGNHDLTPNVATENALRLLDECRAKLDQRRNPSPPVNVLYKKAVERITERIDKRFRRIEDDLRDFITANPSAVALSRTGDRVFDVDVARLVDRATAADITRFLDQRKISGFSEEEIDSLKSAYRRWETTSKSGRRKKIGKQ